MATDSDDTDNAGDTIPSPPPEPCLCSFGELCIYYMQPPPPNQPSSDEYCQRCGGTRR